MTLTKSHVVGPTTPAVREMTFGDLLRQAAEAAPDRLALIAGVPDPTLRRQWTYAQLYREQFAEEDRGAAGMPGSRGEPDGPSAPDAPTEPGGRPSPTPVGAPGG